MPRNSNQLDSAQKIIPNVVLLAIFSTLGLVWLFPIIGGKANRIFWHLTFGLDISAGWLSVFVALLAILAALLKVSRRPLLAPAISFFERHIGWISAATLPFYAALAFFVAQRHAFSGDEVSVLLQSQIFSSGQLAGRVPPELIDWVVAPVAQGLSIQVSHASGQITSTYSPGFALLLSPFTWLGVPYLCNPLLTSLSVWVLYRVTRTMLSSEAAFWATIFALSSPVIALSAATYYTTPAHLLCNLLFCWLLAQQTRRAAFLAGIVGSFALILHNPVPHALFALPWLTWMAIRRRDLLFPTLLGYCTLAPLLGMGWNRFLSGFDPGSYVLEVRAANLRNAAGLSPTFWERLSQVLSWPDRDLWLTRMAGLCKLLIWATPGLGVLAWQGAAQLLNRKSNRRSNQAAKLEKNSKSAPFLRLTAWSFIATFLGYMFVRFDQGAGWGFRYVHSAWMALPILAGYFLANLSPDAAVGRPNLRRYFGWCAALSLLIIVPFRCLQVGNFIRFQRAQVPLVPIELSSSSPLSPSLTFVELKSGYHTVELVQNDPFLRNSAWKLVSNGTARNEALARRVLRAPRRVKAGKWGEIWVGESFTPRYVRWQRDLK